MRVLALAALFVSALAFETPSFHDSRHVRVFAKWKKEFHKTYKNVAEEAHRFAVFAENWRYIESVNQLNLGYELGLNQFGDLTAREFRRYVHGSTGSCLKRGQKPLNVLKMDNANISAPASVDWTTKGVVTPVKNQGQCGSCWAFSTTGSIESAAAIKTGKLVSLSEQQLVDCSRSYGNMGCQGGLMDNAFKYVKSEGGLCSESEYKYTARNGQCKASSCGQKYDAITGYTDVAHDSASALMAAVAKGPVSIAIEADQSSFQFYKKGILTATCGTRLDHGVLVVGYGAEGSEEYWKVKNSWGASWGEEGYIRMCRECHKNGAAGECGILSEPSYPLV